METGGRVASFQSLSEYWTTCNHNQAEKRLIYCQSRDMIHDHRASIFFVLCTLLLTWVSHVVT